MLTGQCSGDFLSDGYRSEGIDTLMAPEHVKVEMGKTLLIYS